MKSTYEIPRLFWDGMPISYQMTDGIQLLSLEISLAREARDRLLPKLMTDGIEV